MTPAPQGDRHETDMGLNLQPGALAMAAILFGAGPALSAAPEIGDTIAVKNKVTVEAGATPAPWPRAPRSTRTRCW